jgi:hexokinase
VSNIKTLKDPSKGRPQDSMVINMEWGSFISDLLPMTADDYATDSTGANPGKCFFEKLISGMFMGEAVITLPPPQTLSSLALLL